MSHSTQLAIGVDVGGTEIKAALVDRLTGTLLQTSREPTEDGSFLEGQPVFAHRVRQMLAALEGLAGGDRLPVGLCAPGIAHPGGRWIDWMPGRMLGLEKLDWSSFLDREVQVLNDAHAALLGEAWTGAARGCRDVVMFTLGTAVGGAILSGGRLLKGSIGRAGHLGHIALQADGEPDSFQTPGSLDFFLGERSLPRRTQNRHTDSRSLLAAARAGEEDAVRWWDESMRCLAVAVASLVNVLDPELVVFGGGVATGAADALLTPLQAHLDRYEWRPGGRRVALAIASAGSWAGALGCTRPANTPE
jgi:glucokinase